MKKTRRGKIDKMASWVKVLAARSHNLSPDPQDGRKELILQVVLWSPHGGNGMHARAHKINK